MHFGHHDSQFSWLRNSLQYVYYFLKITSWCNIFNSPIILGLSLPVRCVSMSQKLSCWQAVVFGVRSYPPFAAQHLQSPRQTPGNAALKRWAEILLYVCSSLWSVSLCAFFHYLVCWELKFFQAVADTVWQRLGPLHFSCNQITSWQIRVHRGLCLLGKGCSVYSPCLLRLEMHQMLWAPLSVPRTNCLLCAGGSSS